MRETWSFLNSHGFRIQADHTRLRLPRVNDSFLMEKLSQLPLTKSELQRINKCRIYIKALTLSDITDAYGDTLLSSSFDGSPTKDRNSIMRWPRQGKPLPKDLALWHESLKRAYPTFGTNKLLHALGEWHHRSHQQWLWRHDIRSNILYRIYVNIYIKYVPRPTTRRRTRQGGKWFTRHIVIDPVHGPFIQICSVLRHSTNNILLTSTSYSSRDPLPPMITTPPIHSDAPLFTR